MPDNYPTKEQVIGWLWDNKDWVIRKVKELRNWFRGTGQKSGQAGILILGAGGVGKTTLARLLSGDFDLLLDGIEQYDESIGIERYILKDAANVEIVVPPGQQHRREATWADLHADIAAGKYRGIVLVSAHGYHSLGEGAGNACGVTKQKKDVFLRALLKSNRLDELAVVHQLLPHLQVNPAKMWFVSLIAKQDLWWPIHAKVEDYYRDGAYGVEIRSTFTQKPALLRHEFVFASLLIANFATRNNVVLKPNAEGYDYPRQIQSLRRLFETIDALKNWESEP